MKRCSFLHQKGYGNIVPATVAGQAVTIVYAFIGIPFLLMVLADLGKLFTRWIKAVFFYVKLFYHTGKFRKARKIGRRATAMPVQYMSVAWNKMPYIVYQGRAKKSPEKVSGETDVEKIGSKDADDTKRKHDADSKEKEKNKKGSEKVETAKEEPEESEEQTEAQIIQEEEETDEFNLPVSLAVILLITYMMLGAFIFTLWEDWTFFESFYFVFVSMSTIGFGDYVPDHPMYMMATFIYLLFGLALTSMCINVVQEKLSAIFQMAKMRIGTTVGLDANILMEDDVMSDKSDTPDSKRRGSSLKSRRGSKAPPAMSQDKDEDEYKPSDSPHSKENGVKDEPIMSTDI